MSYTLLLTIPGAEDENGADYDLHVYEGAEGTLVFERGPGTQRGACGEEAELVRAILRFIGDMERLAGRIRELERWAEQPAESRITGAAAERERIRLELLAEAEFREEHAKSFPLGRNEPGGLYDLARADALRDFARRLGPVTASAYVDGKRVSATAATPEQADAELTRLAGLEGE